LTATVLFQSNKRCDFNGHLDNEIHV